MRRKIEKKGDGFFSKNEIHKGGRNNIRKKLGPGVNEMHQARDKCPKLRHVCNALYFAVLLTCIYPNKTYVCTLYLVR